jgi:methylisocitrate lyase
VQEIENAGLAGLHIEDQFNPKRCGHLDGKNVVDLDTATKRIRAAADARRDPNFLIMARTDIRATDGLQAAKDRAKALVDAGADAIFPEAMRDLAEFQAIRDAVTVPILANMTEFGKSELFSTRQLQAVGVNMVIYPVTLLRSAMGAAERVLDTLRLEGCQETQVEAMLTRARLYDLVDYEAYNRFDTGVFDFRIPGRSQNSAHLPDKDVT